jgi:hypothetical protein
MAIKKTQKRRNTKKAGMSTITKVVIGGAGLSLAYLGYDYFIVKPKRSAEALKKAAEDAAKVTANVITDGTNANTVFNAIVPDVFNNSDNAAILPENARKLSPIGTPGNKQNWGMKLYKGDKGGEIETLQKLFNRLSKVYGTNKITVDGDFGSATENKRTGNKFDNGVTLMKVYNQVKKVEAKDKESETPTGTGYDILYTLGIF